METGDIVKELRKSLGLNQEQFATRCELRRTDVTLVETGENKLGSHAKRAALAQGLRVSLDEFDAMLSGRVPIDEARRLVVQRAAEA